MKPQSAASVCASALDETRQEARLHPKNRPALFYGHKERGRWDPRAPYTGCRERPLHCIQITLKSGSRYPGRGIKNLKAHQNFFDSFLPERRSNGLLRPNFVKLPCRTHAVGIANDSGIVILAGLHLAHCRDLFSTGDRSVDLCH